METAFQRIRAGGTAATPSNSTPTANNGTKTTRAAGTPGSAGVSAGGTAAVTRAPAASASAARTRWVTFAGLALRSDGWTFRLVRAGFLARQRGDDEEDDGQRDENRSQSKSHGGEFDA